MKRIPAEPAVAGELVRIAVGNAAAVVAVAVHNNVYAWDLVVRKVVVVADHSNVDAWDLVFVAVVMADRSIASVGEVPLVFVVVEQLELMEEMGKIWAEYFLLLVEEESKWAEEPVKK